MRILYVITGLTLGGAEKQVSLLISRLKKEHDIRVVCFRDGSQADALRQQGITVTCIGTERYAGFLRAFSKTRRILKEFRPDVIHSFLPHANVLMKLINLFSLGRWKLICSIRVTERRLFLYNLMERVLDPLCELTTTNSHTTKSFLVKRFLFNRNKLKVIYNGHVFAKATPKKLGEGVQVITVAKFREQKDYTTNVDACEKVRTRDVTFNYVGEGPKREEIQRYVERKGLGSRVRFLGSRDDVPALLRGADIFFLPTLYEGQSNALVEAMHYGCPIVTTDIPENREILSEKEARLCRPKDAEGMAQAIDELIRSKKEAQRMAKRAYEKSKRFSSGEMVSRYREVYRAVR